MENSKSNKNNNLQKLVGNQPVAQATQQAAVQVQAAVKLPVQCLSSSSSWSELGLWLKKLFAVGKGVLAKPWWLWVCAIPPIQICGGWAHILFAPIPPPHTFTLFGFFQKVVGFQPPTTTCARTATQGESTHYEKGTAT